MLCVVQGRYGVGCNRVCECQNGGTCDAESGRCHCPPGVRGQLCEDGCPAGLYHQPVSSQSIIASTKPLCLSVPPHHRSTSPQQSLFITCHFRSSTYIIFSVNNRSLFSMCFTYLASGTSFLLHSVNLIPPLSVCYTTV